MRFFADAQNDKIPINTAVCHSEECNDEESHMHTGGIICDSSLTLRMTEF